MADPRQQMMDAILAGTFDNLDKVPRLQPGYTMEQIYGGILPTANAPGAFASTFPARPEVPFQNNTRLAGRLPSIPLNIDGATGVAASDWFSQPGTYVGSSAFPDGRMSVADLPALPKQPLSITVNGGNPSLIGSRVGDTMFGPPTGPASMVAAVDPAQAAIDAYMANPPDFRGRDKGNAALGYYGGTDDMGASALPSIAAIDAAMLPQIGPSGTTNAGYTYTNGQRTGKADWAAGLTPAQQYALANAFAASNAGNASGVLPTGGVFQNGIKVGDSRPAGMSAATAYDNANAAAKARAQAQSTSGYTQSSNNWFNEVTGR